MSAGARCARTCRPRPTRTPPCGTAAWTSRSCARDEEMLAVSVGKSFLAAVTADVNEETPFDRSTSFRSWTASSTSSALEQYDGLLLPQPAASNAAMASARMNVTAAGRRDDTAGRPTLSQNTARMHDLRASQ